MKYSVIGEKFRSKELLHERNVWEVAIKILYCHSILTITLSVWRLHITSWKRSSYRCERIRKSVDITGKWNPQLTPHPRAGPVWLAGGGGDPPLPSHYITSIFFPLPSPFVIFIPCCFTGSSFHVFLTALFRYLGWVIYIHYNSLSLVFVNVFCFFFSYMYFLISFFLFLTILHQLQPIYLHL